MFKPIKCLASRGVIATVILSILAIIPAFSQNKKAKIDTTKAGKITPKKDSIAVMNQPLKYDKVITKDAQIFKGLFTINKVKDRYYFEIPDSLINREFHVISRIGKAPALLQRGFVGFAGDDLGDTQISFTKAPGNKLFVKQLVYNERSADTSANGLYQALANNNIQPILAVFDIKTYGKDSSIIIDVTDYLNSDFAIITGDIKRILSVQALQPDRSYIESVHAYPLNMEAEMIKTYTGNGNLVTAQVNVSFVLLPKIPMSVRYADERIGYAKREYTDFDQDPQRAKVVDIINRWRMEPKSQDMARYLKGELVEPVKPIVFYIDPATPKKWVPYLIKGINDWEAAFEKAGFKNAIYGRETMKNDTAWNMDDDRYNLVIYAPSISRTASQNTVSDPRSGEILHANIHLDHNVMTLLHDMYMLQAGAIDKKARHMEFSNELMGELLRGAVSINVGYTLGLVDNDGASSTIPVDSLRSKTWVEIHGHSPTIMQDAFYNYVAQPNDGINEKGILPRVGEYDKWAINWGYRYFPNMHGAIEERLYLRKLIADSLRMNKRLYYGAAAKELVSDPRNQGTDLGNDAIKATELGVSNLKRIVSQLPQWSVIPDQVYSANSNTLARMATALQGQFQVYMINVANVFGTIYYTPHDAQSNKKVYAFVPVFQQKRAMNYLGAELFTAEPRWMVTKEITDRGIALPYNNYVYTTGVAILSDYLLNTKRLKNINATAERFGANNTYSLSAYLDDLVKYIWLELGISGTVSSYHMILQKTYLLGLEKVIDTKRDVNSTNTVAIVRGHLIYLKEKVIAAIKKTKDRNTLYHYRDIIAQINALTDPKRPVPAAGLNIGKPISMSGFSNTMPDEDNRLNY